MTITKASITITIIIVIITTITIIIIIKIATKAKPFTRYMEPALVCDFCSIKWMLLEITQIPEDC